MVVGLNFSPLLNTSSRCRTPRHEYGCNENGYIMNSRSRQENELKRIGVDVLEASEKVIYDQYDQFITKRALLRSILMKI